MLYVRSSRWDVELMEWNLRIVRRYARAKVNLQILFTHSSFKRTNESEIESGVRIPEDRLKGMLRPGLQFESWTTVRDTKA